MWAVIALSNSSKRSAKAFFAELKNELILLLLALATMIVIFKIAYYKENFIVVARASASLFWLFILPGYSIMLYWKQKLGFTERIVIGTAAAMAVAGLASYYLGLAGLKLQNQTFLLPFAIIVISCAAALLSWERKGQEQLQEQGPQ